MATPQSQLHEIHYKVSSILTLLQDLNLSELLEELDLTEEFSFVNSVKDKLNKLIDVNRVEERLAVTQKIADKFYDYMKNVDKLNMLVNEFKGCVAMSRAAIVDPVALEKRIDEKIDALKQYQEVHLMLIRDHMDAMNRKLNDLYEKIDSKG